MNNESFFLSTLSHELRSPLNGIVGYCQLLSQTKLDHVQKRYVNSMNFCSMQLVELVNDILDLSHIMAGKTNVNTDCFSITEIIEEVKAAVEYRITEKKQKLKFIISEDPYPPPDYIISDKHKLIQILVNLISNSNKFTKIGGRIIVTISSSENKVFFSVEDDGIGISPEDQKNLFTPFFQIQRDKGGSGLGLAITKKLVELLGGKISVESDTNEGSIFSFHISFEQYEKFGETLKKNLERLKGSHVMIIEPDVDVRLQLEEIFFENNMTAILCSSLKEGLKLIKRYNFFAIFVDLSLENLSTFINKIREKSVTFLIGLNDTDNMLFDNLSATLHKPINKIKLLDTICKLYANEEKFMLNEVKEVIPKGSNISILVAEDIKYNLEALTELLNSLEYYDITCCENGYEALRKIEEKTYDILLLDLKMPIMGGIELLEALRKKGIKQPKTAIITGSILEEDKERCKQLNVKYFLIKPFTLVQLKSIMYKLVNGTMTTFS